MTHFEDKVLTCVKCKRQVKIPHNQIGGFWHLNGYADPSGTKHYGGHCLKCFDKLKMGKKERL